MTLIVSMTTVGAKRATLRLHGLGDLADDLRPAFERIADDFLEVEKRRFATRGGGTWRPLKASTIRRKRREGADLRVMRRSGELARSLTVRGAPGQIRDVGRDDLVMGTSVRHAAPHQRRKGGRRPVFVNRTARSRWAQMIRDHLLGS